MAVLEVALVDVIPGREAAFQAALREAADTVLPRAAGFLEFTLHGTGIERPSTVLFTIRWMTLDDHMIGFRESPLFAEWRALIGEYFAAPPFVEHFAVG